jgi:ATP-dependent Clp protease ATP-binding subunit ClpA
MTVTLSRSPLGRIGGFTSEHHSRRSTISPMLLGRDAEQRVVDELLQSARTGSSAVLVLRGEPGIGKSALLGYAQSRAAGMNRFAQRRDRG